MYGKCSSIGMRNWVCKARNFVGFGANLALLLCCCTGHRTKVKSNSVLTFLDASTPLVPNFHHLPLSLDNVDMGGACRHSPHLGMHNPVPQVLILLT